MRRQEDNIKMGHQEILFDEVDWNQLIQNRTQWRNSVQMEMNCYYYYYYYYYLNFSLLSFQLENIHPSWDLVIKRNRLGGLIYNLGSSLQLNTYQELQIFAFVYMYLDAS
jgi:hypothetical protein